MPGRGWKGGCAGAKDRVHSVTVPPLPPVASRSPPGENTANHVEPGLPCSVIGGAIVGAADQRSTLMSWLPLSRCSPCGWMARHVTPSLCPPSTDRRRPLTGSQTMTARSCPPLTSAVPPGEKASVHTSPLCPVNVRRSCSLATSHSLIAPSSAALASVPLVENATARTGPSWPASVIVSPSPLLRSHSLTVLSLDPLARVRPSGDTASAWTAARCPSIVASSLSPEGSHSLILWS